MTITDTCYSQSIILEKAISLQLPVAERGTYSVQCNIIGIRGVTGFGNWSNNFQMFTDGNGTPISVNYALIGEGTYYIRGNPSISNLIATLQINIVYPDEAPLPKRDPTETIWKGPIILTGGSLTGILTRETIVNAISPNHYNVKGCYHMKFENGMYNLYVTDLRII